MRKLIVSEFVTLDGVMEAPGGEPSHPHSGWVFDHMSPEQEHYKLDEVMDAESLLLGRVTYEGFSAAWPSVEGDSSPPSAAFFDGGSAAMFSDSGRRAFDS